MNIKMAKIHIHQQVNLKNKRANKQNRNRIIDTEIIWSVIIWEEEGGEWGKICRDLVVQIGRYRIDREMLRTV